MKRLYQLLAGKRFEFRPFCSPLAPLVLSVQMWVLFSLGIPQVIFVVDSKSGLQRWQHNLLCHFLFGGSHLDESFKRFHRGIRSGEVIAPTSGTLPMQPVCFCVRELACSFRSILVDDVSSFFCGDLCVCVFTSVCVHICACVCVWGVYCLVVFGTFSERLIFKRPSCASSFGFAVLGNSSISAGRKVGRVGNKSLVLESSQSFCSSI